MDTLTLLESLQKINKKCNNKFRVGVFAADTLPHRVRKPAALIQNLDDKTQKGSHWTAIFLPSRGKGEYFCSYGIPPLIAAHKRFLLRHSPAGFFHNKKVLQQIDSVECGPYCLLYLANRMSGVSMAKFLKHFDSEVEKNDMMTRSLSSVLLKNL